jgi:hypothetical protein
MSGSDALALGALAMGIALLFGALLYVRAASRSSAATRAEVARLEARIDAQVPPGSADGSQPEASRPEPSASAVVRFTDPHPSPAEEPVFVPTRAEVAAAALQEPLVRVAVVAAGLRHALRPESRDRARAVVRREYQRRSKLRRRAARHAARTTVVVPEESPGRERAS